MGLLEHRSGAGDATVNLPFGHIHYSRTNQPECPVTDIGAGLFVDGFRTPCLLSYAAPAFTNCEEEATRMADPPTYPGAPRWLWMFGAAASVVALLLIALIHVGGAPHHGMPSFGGPGAAQENSH